MAGTNGTSGKARSELSWAGTAATLNCVPRLVSMIWFLSDTDFEILDRVAHTYVVRERYECMWDMYIVTKYWHNYFYTDMDAAIHSCILTDICTVVSSEFCGDRLTACLSDIASGFWLSGPWVIWERHNDINGSKQQNFLFGDVSLLCNHLFAGLLIFVHAEDVFGSCIS